MMKIGLISPANNLPTLIDVLSKNALIEDAIQDSNKGFSSISLMPIGQMDTPLSKEISQQLDMVFKQLSLNYQTVLVDASLTTQDLLPIKALNDGVIIIQLSHHAESIQEGYALIKQLYNQLGTRSFGILVDGASDAKGQLVFKRIEQVARSFMHIQLEYLGSIPPDMYLSRAKNLGRSVVEAFPMTIAAQAFKQIAKRLEATHQLSKSVHPLQTN